MGENSISTFINLVIVIFIIAIIIICNCSTENFKNNVTEMFSMVDRIDKEHEVSSLMTLSDIKNWKQAQRKMTKMMKKFVKICNDNNINNWWVTGGTLIGTCRHKGWIPWDGDIDLAMLYDDYVEFKNAVLNKNSKGKISSKMWLQCTETDSKAFPENHTRYTKAKIRDLYSCYKKNKPPPKWDLHSGLQIDIFTYDISDDGQTLVPQYRELNDIKTYPKSLILGPSDSADPKPSTRLFENIKVNVPYDYKEYCILNFKTYPPENIPIEKRRPHEGDGHCDPDKPCQHTIDQYSSLYN